MNIPKARKLSSGKWFIQMRLGGESVSVSDFDKKKCEQEAKYLKAQYQAGKRTPKEDARLVIESKTLTEAIENYLKSKSNTLSPSTIRGYKAIQKNRFKDIMNRKIDDIEDGEWQSIINSELELASPKTVTNAFKFLRTVIKQQTGHEIPMKSITLPLVPPAEISYLSADEILLFVNAIKDTKVAVAALLALSSLRISEISALRWEDIPSNPKFINVKGSIVRGDNSTWVKKQQNKNAASTRKVPILIPELSEAIEKFRKPSGPIMDYDQDTLRVTVHKACKAAGITDVTVHGLRHSFASLAYHLNIPERIAMEMGGWSDPGTMHKRYIHIAKSDISRYQTAMADFYSQKEKAKNANKNAN